MTMPVVMLGPGGDYVVRYMARDAKMAAATSQANGHDPDNGSASTTGGYGGLARRSAKGKSRRSRPPDGFGPTGVTAAVGRGEDVFEHETQTDGSGIYRAPVALADNATDRLALSQLAESIDAWLAVQQRTLAQVRAMMPTVSGAAMIGFGVALDVTARRRKVSGDIKKFVSESDAQKTSRAFVHPQSSTGTRLFADDLEIDRPTRRQQSCRLRARRNAYRKEGDLVTAQQGTLFAG